MDSDWKSRLKQRLRELEISQEELAKNIGITQSQISHFITGRNRLHLDDIKKICVALDISADWLLFGKLNKQPKSSFSQETSFLISQLENLPEKVKEPIRALIETLSSTNKNRF